MEREIPREFKMDDSKERRVLNVVILGCDQIQISAEEAELSARSKNVQIVILIINNYC